MSRDLDLRMNTPARFRAGQAGSWAAVGAAAAVATGSTPIGVVVVAALSGGLAWRLLGRSQTGVRRRGRVDA
jgi:hypothetical protein